MTSISIRLEVQLEGTTKFNIWKTRVINILNEHNLDSFVTTVIEAHTTNVGRTNYKKNQAKANRIIYDSVKENLMLVITPLRIAKECFDTLINIYEKKDPTRHAGRKNYKMNPAKENRIIYDCVKDNLMMVITPLKTENEYFDTHESV